MRFLALNFNWMSRTSTVGTVDSLCNKDRPLVPPQPSGSPIEPEGLPCTSHCAWVLLCTRLLIMDSVLSSLETLVLCACQ